jgi:regulation of enolase protein 1 (concanavalin A-like superfamily)
VATHRIPGFPAPLRWFEAPFAWQLADDGSLSIQAGPRTDLFLDPRGSAAVFNAPRLLGPVSGDFQLISCVSVDFKATFDAGVLLIYVDDRTWAKLCFEYSPQGEPMVVSVVTRGLSDDCNSFIVDGHQVWLRVSRLGAAFAFHASLDGESWQFIRHFALDAPSEVQLGFVAQSPTGEACTARFNHIRFQPETLPDLRSGT